jgi:PAS domain S-box-containing protein
MAEALEPLTSRWEVAFFVLLVVMAAMLWRQHRETSRLGEIAAKTQEHLVLLAETVETIEGKATNTEHTLIANLAEYRMAVGNTSGYREYLQKLGVAPAADVEPILEAIPDGAFAVGKDGRFLYVNRAHRDLTGLTPGATVDEMLSRADFRSLGGAPLQRHELPEIRVLNGAEVHELLLRMRPEGAGRDVILSVNGSPVKDVLGRTVAAVLIARPMSEEVALAVEVRQRAQAEAAGSGTLVG